MNCLSNIRFGNAPMNRFTHLKQSLKELEAIHSIPDIFFEVLDVYDRLASEYNMTLDEPEIIFFSDDELDFYLSPELLAWREIRKNYMVSLIDPSSKIYLNLDCRESEVARTALLAFFIILVKMGIIPLPETIKFPRTPLEGPDLWSFLSILENRAADFIENNMSFFIQK